MVITKLSGGLGNQMFQYSAGYALARRLSTKLYLDLSWFEIVKKYPEATVRDYELDLFGIQSARPSLTDKAMLKFNPPKIFTENGMGYQKSFDKLSGNILMDGYWQSYKYFKGCEPDVRNTFSSLPELSPKSLKYLTGIQTRQSISIHIRRADLITGRHENIPLALNYYKLAISKVTQGLDNPVFYVFSDDPDWSKINLKVGKEVVFIENNKNYEDLRLMSACRHNIIANSSFSWWGAWLNSNPSKKVIAPKKWFRKQNTHPLDRLPKSWIMI